MKGYEPGIAAETRWRHAVRRVRVAAVVVQWVVVPGVVGMVHSGTYPGGAPWYRSGLLLTGSETLNLGKTKGSQENAEKSRILRKSRNVRKVKNSQKITKMSDNSRKCQTIHASVRQFTQ